MNIDIAPDAKQLGQRAAALGAVAIREAIAARGEANIIVATGASQFQTLAALVAEEGIDWSAVNGFHLDEYIGLPLEHPASFRGYLAERFVNLVPLKSFHYVDGENNPQAECRRLAEEIQAVQIDVAFVGIGENGHLAFNDPPADFQTEDPYLVVHLDPVCRQQQYGEGWFETLDDVPNQAISMSVRQIMKTTQIVCSVPDGRKASAVGRAVEGPVSPDIPASILQEHANASLFLDVDAASQLKQPI